MTAGTGPILIPGVRRRALLDRIRAFGSVIAPREEPADQGEPDDPIRVHGTHSGPDSLVTPGKGVRPTDIPDTTWERVAEDITRERDGDDGITCDCPDNHQQPAVTVRKVYPIHYDADCTVCPGDATHTVAYNDGARFPACDTHARQELHPGGPT